MAGTKRASSGGASKRELNKVAKKCKTIATCIRKSESVSEQTRSMVNESNLVKAFGVYKVDREICTKQIVDLVGKSLKTTQDALQKAINEAQAEKAAQDAQGANLTAANNGAQAASDAAGAAADASKQALTDSQTALRDAKKGLEDLEAAVKTCDANVASTTAKKDKVEALIKDFFVPVKDGTLHKSATSAGNYLEKHFEDILEPEFMTCVVTTFSKASKDWGTFDNIIDKKFDACLKTITTNVAAELQRLEAEKGPRAANIENAKAAVAGGDEKEKAAEEALKNATAAGKAAVQGAKAAVATLKTQEHNIEKAAHTLANAAEAMKDFTEGALADFKEVESLEKPPEPEKPAEAAPAPLVQAMTAAPQGAAAAPKVLPSPGVLFMQAAQGVASGVARTVGLSPRVASSPGPRTS